MSSPYRQMNNRRLPPLPSIGKRSVSPRHPSVNQRTPGIPFRDLPQDDVVQYLNNNPEFLDRYVHSHVNQDQIIKWAVRRGLITNGRLKSSQSAVISENKNTFSKWKAKIQRNRTKLIQELAEDVQQHTSKVNVLNELANCVSSVVCADGYNIYIVDEINNDTLCSVSSQAGDDFSGTNGLECNISTQNIHGKIGVGTTIAAYVASTKDTLRTSDPNKDKRFPDGIGINADKVQYVLADPIFQSNGDLIGVVELYRKAANEPFSLEDEQASSSLTMWTDILFEYVEITNSLLMLASSALHFAEIKSVCYLMNQTCRRRYKELLRGWNVHPLCAQMYSSMMKQRKLNEFLLTVTKSIFQDMISMDTVIMKIMNFAQKLVNADRASLFLLDSHTGELFARIFDVGSGAYDTDQKEIRFPMNKGVAGYVASSGRILNIPDAYGDDRFNRDVDIQTGYRTRTILCMPIYIRGNIIGVVQMVNKLNGVFSKSDEESFEMFAVYCGLALHHAKLYEKIRRSEQKYRVALEVLSYHRQSTEEEVNHIKALQFPTDLPALIDYDFSPWAVTGDEKPVHVLYMFKDLFKVTRFEFDDLIRFTLTVKKNYRHVPYHNWDHAFSVAHAMYTVVKTSAHKFTSIEVLALYVACLCHDLDHRGKTNAFMVKSASPLAAIYSTSTMEHHHFNQTVTILQHEGHNIFRHLSSDEYKTVLADIRHAILATDLALFFGNKATLKDIMDKGEFSWDNYEHRHLVMGVGMTAADLCAMYKPWQVQLDVVYSIMEEFWQQGDEEKSQGITPMAMMDREKKNELPQLEVGFIVGICLPCYELMMEVLPETKPMCDGVSANLKQWKELADKEKAIQDEKKQNST